MIPLGRLEFSPEGGRLSGEVLAATFERKLNVHTGRLVVPEVYSIIPPLVIGNGTRWTSSSPLPVSLFSTALRTGFLGRCSRPSLRTSSAFSLNLPDESNVTASLFSSMYLSSLAGKPEESGTAMLSHASMERRVTVSHQLLGRV